MDADLLLLLGEIDARRLYAEKAFPSMFAFCTQELGFSEDVACNRIDVARLARRFPGVVDFVRAGRIHLSGLRLLQTVLTEENVDAVLAAAAGKSKRAIEELVAGLAPRPFVLPSIRKLPERAPAVTDAPPTLPLPLTDALPVETSAEETSSQMAPTVSPPTLPQSPPLRRPEVKPLSAEAYKVEFTADLALKAKLEKAEELMRHRLGPGNVVGVIDRALDLLIEEVTKERFGAGRTPRSTAAEAEQREVVTRHIPDAIKREVYERDGGQCTYVSDEGRRCQERGGLEFEHPEGFALTGRHAVEELTLHCRAHNQHSAAKLYGRDFMQARRRVIRPGADKTQQSMLL
jgi:hypothetical protein